MAALLAIVQPPTPPKYADRFLDDAIRSLDTSFIGMAKEETSHNARQKRELDDTPPPSSPIQALDSQAQPPQKRLRFSLEPSVCDAIHPSSQTSPNQSNPKTPEIRSKSILKSSESFQPLLEKHKDPKSFVLDGSQSFTSLVETAIHALKGSDVTSKRDAYSCLSSGLRTYKNYPNVEDMRPHMDFFETALERDSKSISVLESESKLVEQALQCAFNVAFRFPHDLSAKFFTGLIDRSIQALEESDASKEILKHKLNLLTLDPVYGKFMTADRLRRLLKGLATIDEQRSGYSILRLRMIIYRQIVSNFPNVFVEEVQHHIINVFHALLSNNKEARACAIETALYLGSVLAHRQRFTRAIRILLETKSKDGTIYLEHLCHHLNSMLHRSYDIEHVPQIWGAIMVTTKGDPTLAWKMLACKDWLMILQQCFNKSSPKLDRLSWTAWRHTIHAGGGLLYENEAAIKRLSAPVCGYLQRAPKGDQRFSIHDAAYEAFYLLLYYAFGQPTTPQQCELTWRRLVHDTFQSVLGKNKCETQRFANIFANLLAGNGLKVWKADRGLSKTPLTSSDLPKLDPLWVRKNVGIVLETMACFIEVDPDGSNPAFLEIWTSLIKSVSQAGEREVMPSSDARRAVSSMSDFLMERFPAGASEDILNVWSSLPAAKDESFAHRPNHPLQTAPRQEQDSFNICAGEIDALPCATADDVPDISALLPKNNVLNDMTVHENGTDQSVPLSEGVTDESTSEVQIDLSVMEPATISNNSHSTKSIEKTGKDMVPQNIEIIEFAPRDNSRVQKPRDDQSYDETSIHLPAHEAAVQELCTSIDVAGDTRSILGSSNRQDIHSPIINAETDDTDLVAQDQVDDGDCIVMQEVNINTPSLRDLLRARGVLPAVERLVRNPAEALEKIVHDIRRCTDASMLNVEELEDLGLELLKELSLLRRTARGRTIAEACGSVEKSLDLG